MYYLTCGLLICTGLASVLLNASGNSLLQMSTPDRLRGRVLSIYFLLIVGSTPIGGYITGVLAQHYQIRPTMGMEAAVCSMGMLWAFYYYKTRRIRAVDHPPAEVEPELKPVEA
jgi:MFS family permease